MNEAHNIAMTHEATGTAGMAKRAQTAALVAETERTDAVTSGIVQAGDHSLAGMKRGGKTATSRKVAQGTADKSVQDAQEVVDKKLSLQRTLHLKAAIADEAVEQLDDTDELSGVQGVYQGSRITARTSRRIAAKVNATKAAKATKGADAAAGAAKTRAKTKAAKATRRMQSRRTWLAARKAQETSATTVAASAARKGGAKTLAAAISSALAPLSGVLAGIIGFILVAMLVSQMIAALFGFWQNEDTKKAVTGLPPYITTEMVEAALQCQEDYGHPAGCTLAQIICESGQGDHLSGLATQDNNLFGIKWASSFAAAPEVSGKSSWVTGEEYDGQSVTIMADFTTFKSMKDCIFFRSRVLLANSRYADNALIKQAIAEHSSDKMAEGLKDAGYATSSTYVEGLKTAMSRYNLYRFDTMTVEQFKSGEASGNAIIAAAHSQLGVPYRWGGTTPGVGLDCSGLVQYCYAQAGKNIPRNSEDQASGGMKVPLSMAQPGDILWKPGHVAIYIGGDQYIHEPQTGDVCRIANGIAYFTCAVRYI